MIHETQIQMMKSSGIIQDDEFGALEIDLKNIDPNIISIDRTLSTVSITTICKNNLARNKLKKAFGNIHGWQVIEKSYFKPAN